MNKEELLNLVESLNMPRDEYYILGGGSLVMFGIKDKTADLDLCVSEELFARLKEEYNLDEKDKNNRYKGTGYILKHMWQVSHRRIGS